MSVRVAALHALSITRVPDTVADHYARLLDDLGIWPPIDDEPGKATLLVIVSLEGGSSSF